MFCNQCGHRNPDESVFCSTCGTALGHASDHTVTLAKVDPLLESSGPEDDVVVDLATLPGRAALVVRTGQQAGSALALASAITRLGRHPDCEISLDDITVSRRHAEVVRTDDGYVVRDAGSLNGTYLNSQRIDGERPLRPGDDLQVGKFHLVFLQRVED